jgi:hypothetical protein
VFSFDDSISSRALTGYGPGPEVSANPIYDALVSEWRLMFRAVPGDRYGEEQLRPQSSPVQSGYGQSSFRTSLPTPAPAPVYGYNSAYSGYDTGGAYVGDHAYSMGMNSGSYAAGHPVQHSGGHQVPQQGYAQQPQPQQYAPAQPTAYPDYGNNNGRHRNPLALVPSPFPGPGQHMSL